MQIKDIEVISRGILIKDEKIVLCHLKKGGHYFLPGGHVEFGERAEDTLVREFREETGSEIKVEKFIGAFENKFGENPVQHEINLVFLISSTADSITSIENHIDYVHVSKEDFADINLLPKFLKEIILNFWSNPQTIWGSGI